MRLFSLRFEYIEYVLSIPLLFLIIFDFFKALKDFASLIIKTIKSRDKKEKKNLKQIFLIKVGFLLPWEIMSLAFTIIFTFFIFHWFTSSIFILCLAGLLFKQVISEIPYIVLSAIYSIIKKPLFLKPDVFTEETGIISPNFPSSIYIPQKAKNIEEVYAAIGQGLRALRNNSSPRNNLMFIYHSDTEDPYLVREEIRLMLEAREEFGSRVFLFCRNKEAYNPLFLKKPGGYMSDYQILTRGIWHPLTYTANTFDGRMQKILRQGKTEDFFPFYPNSLNEECQFFIKYDKDLFVKERLIFEKNIGLDRTFNSEIKIISGEYLVNMDSPIERYLINNGAIVNLKGETILKANQWKIDTFGKIEVIQGKQFLFEGKFFSFIFANIMELSGNKKLFLDKLANLLDMETGEVWAKREDYIIEHVFSLYKYNNGTFKLIRKDFEVNKDQFCGEDYRRLIFDRFNTVPRESIDGFIKEGLIPPSEALQALETGLIGDIYGLHIAKNGFEQEFFVEDSLFVLKEKVDGGYLVRKSAGFDLDKEGNLIYKDSVVEPKDNLKEIFIREEKGKKYLVIEERGIRHFLRDSTRMRKIESKEGEIFFYIKNPWINKTKPARGGFIVNEKDGFLLDKNESLWFITDIYQELLPVKIAEKTGVRKVIKESVFIDYRRGECLKKSRLISEVGSWYKDENSVLRKRKFIASKDFVHFNENLDAVVFSPLSKERKIYPLGSYSIGRNYLWSKEEDMNCEIIPQKDLNEQNGDLVREEIIVLKGQYHFNADGKVIIGSQIFPYGTYLKFENGQIAEDTLGNFIFADSCIKIINQTDSDAEFQPLTIPYINSRLIRNLWEDSPYLMYQPEISFANQGQSIFSRFNSWAQQIYRFTGRAFFNVFGESSAYGKMTKLIEAYVSNIVFKEAIPPIARTHDHWEAMHLKTALILSHPALKAKNLIENTPPNFFAFLKRQEGWIGGDLVLLEHESTFGIALDYLRALICLVRFDFQGLRFWKNYSRKRIKYLKERYDSPSHLAKLFRIWMINRIIFCPFYYGIWLMLVGSFSLIIPGALTVKSTSLSWILFWSTLGILIVLSKVIVPFLERFLYYETKKAKFLIVIAATATSIIINILGESFSPNYWKWLNSCVLISYLIYQMVLNRIFPFLFFHNKNLLLSLKRSFISIVIFAVGWLYLPVIFEYLSEFPSANWIFIFVFDILPRLSGYLVSWIAILWLFPAGKTLLNLLRKSAFETIYSSSILLLNIIYVPLTVFKKVIFMTLYPNRSIPWITSSSVEKLLKHKLSLEESYAHLFWAPFFSVVFIICPVILGLADASLLFYGWPVFVWSWLMGPYLAWFSGNFGEEEGFSSLEFLTIKDKLYRWKKENYEINTVPSEREIADKILELSLHIKNTLSRREILRLYLYILTDIELDDRMLREAVNKKLTAELAPEKLREYNWLTLNEISRAKIILRLNKNKNLYIILKRGLINTGLMGACLSLVSCMGPRGITTTEWEWLPDYQKLSLFNHTVRKYKLGENSVQQLKTLLQLFTRKEFKVLLKKVKNQENISSLIEVIPEELIYLKTVVKEIDGRTDLNQLSLHQRKNILGLLSLRCSPHEKNCLEILELALKIKYRNSAKN